MNRPKRLTMKESNFYNDDFEELIRQKTDQYKMYPSDKVWKGIYSSLHTKRRRFIVGMSVLIGGILILAGNELLTPTKHSTGLKKPIVIDAPKTNSTDVVNALQAFRKADLTQSSLSGTDDKLNDIRQAMPFDIDVVTNQPETNILSPNFEFNTITAEDVTPDVPKTAVNKTSDEGLVSTLNANINLTQASNASSTELATVQKPDVNKYDESDKEQINWLRDRAIQHLTPIRKNKFTWQVYVSPTFNYRKLSGVDYSRIRSTIQNVPIALIHFGDVNDFVDHSPAVGYEVGGSMLYKLTRNLTLKAGLQFNYSRYIIKAFTSNPE